MNNHIIYNGAYGIPYDPAPAIDKLPIDRDNAMNELWENLYHQGDVGVASYSAVPALVEVGELSLVAAIEIARNSEGNPPLPDELCKVYNDALVIALKQNPSDEEQLKGFYIIHASVSGHSRLAQAINLMDIDEILNEYL